MCAQSFFLIVLGIPASTWDELTTSPKYQDNGKKRKKRNLQMTSPFRSMSITDTKIILDDVIKCSNDLVN